MTGDSSTTYVEIDGLRLAVGINGDGPPFLFLHGLCGDARQPIEVFPEDAGWQCHALESRGMAALISVTWTNCRSGVSQMMRRPISRRSARALP